MSDPIAPPGAGAAFDFTEWWDPPLEVFRGELNRWAVSIDDFSLFWPALAELFKVEMREQFMSEGDVSGPGWADYLDPDYARFKEDLGLPKGVLTTATRSAMTGAGEGWMEAFAPHAATFGMDPEWEHAVVGMVFAYGRKDQPQRPKRPIMRPSIEWANDWRKLLHAWSYATVRDAFGFGGAAGFAADVPSTYGEL